MAGSPDSLEERLADAVSDAVARLYLEKFGKGPLYSETLLTENVVTTVMRDVFTPVENALIAGGKAHSVLANRMLWQEATDLAFKRSVGQVLGRRVLTVVSGFETSHGVATEVFILQARP